MAEFVDLKEIERRLAKVIAKGLGEEVAELLKYLGDPPDLSNVPADYWKNGWKKLEKLVEPILVEVFQQQAEWAMEESGVGVEDWSVIVEDAADWSRVHSDTVLQKLNLNNFESVGKLVQRYYETGMTRKELVKELDKIYKNPVRSEMIATTEITRAAAEGKRAYAAELAKKGIIMIPLWLLNVDKEKNCEDCIPRHNLPIIDDIYPPKHPRCNCRVRYTWESKLTPAQKEMWDSKGGLVISPEAAQ